MFRLSGWSKEPQGTQFLWLLFLSHCAKIVIKELLKWLESSSGSRKSLSKLAWPSYFASFQPDFCWSLSVGCEWYARFICVPLSSMCTAHWPRSLKRPIKRKSHFLLTNLTTCTWSRKYMANTRMRWWRNRVIWDHEEGPAPIISIAYPKHYFTVNDIHTYFLMTKIWWKCLVESRIAHLLRTTEEK